MPSVLALSLTVFALLTGTGARAADPPAAAKRDPEVLRLWNTFMSPVQQFQSKFFIDEPTKVRYSPEEVQAWKRFVTLPEVQEVIAAGNRAYEFIYYSSRTQANEDLQAAGISVDPFAEMRRSLEAQMRSLSTPREQPMRHNDAERIALDEMRTRYPGRHDITTHPELRRDYQRRVTQLLEQTYPRRTRANDAATVNRWRLQQIAEIRRVEMQRIHEMTVRSVGFDNKSFYLVPASPGGTVEKNSSNAIELTEDTLKNMTLRQYEAASSLGMAPDRFVPEYFYVDKSGRHFALIARDPRNSRTGIAPSSFLPQVAPKHAVDSGNWKTIVSLEEGSAVLKRLKVVQRQLKDIPEDAAPQMVREQVLGFIASAQSMLGIDRQPSKSALTFFDVAELPFTHSLRWWGLSQSSRYWFDRNYHPFHENKPHLDFGDKRGKSPPETIVRDGILGGVRRFLEGRSTISSQPGPTLSTSNATMGIVSKSDSRNDPPVFRVKQSAVNKVTFFNLGDVAEAANFVPATGVSNNASSGPVRIESLKAFIVADRQAMVPTPPEYELAGLEIRSNGKLLRQGSDYAITRAPGGDAFAVTMHSQTESIQMIASFRPDSSRPPPSVTLQPISHELIATTNRELREAGITRIADQIDALLARSRGARIPAQSLADIFRNESFYTYSQPGKGLKNSTNRFAPFSQFVNSEGITCLQCSGAANLFTEFMNAVLVDQPGVEAVSRTGFVVQNGLLSQRLRQIMHRRTEIRVGGRAISIFDVTPSRIFSGIVSGAEPPRREATASQRERMRIPTEAAEQAKAAALGHFEKQLPRGIQASEPLAQASRLTSLLLEYVGGSLSDADASTRLDAIIPGMRGNESTGVAEQFGLAAREIRRSLDAFRDQARGTGRSTYPHYLEAEGAIAMNRWLESISSLSTQITPEAIEQARSEYRAKVECIGAQLVK